MMEGGDGCIIHYPQVAQEDNFDSWKTEGKDLKRLNK